VQDETTDDPYDLERFVSAQEQAGTYRTALDELRRGRKETHWMWFVFPQVAGLGHSPTARRYAVNSLDEARAYLEHPVLGPRIRECAAVVADSRTATAEEIFGPLDALKLRSSMTLFHRADPGEPSFEAVLKRFFGGQADPETDRRLWRGGGSAG
jgi:uncharacterized protein (DUF1810 family)